ncbi:MAG: DUF2267 domain-containing protein [Planctomycetota bacterium]
MSHADIPVIQRNLEHLDTWLHDLQQLLACPDDTSAFKALRAVLHSIRDRLVADEAVDLGAQLPLIIRGAYYEEWKPTRTPEKIRDPEEFLERIAEDFGQDCDPEALLRAVLDVLERRIDRGQVQQVLDMLPDEIVQRARRA